MDITHYARSLLREHSDDTVKTWAYEAQRMMAWHAIRLVPLQSELLADEQPGYLELLTSVLSDIDSREPLVVPVAVRKRLLSFADQAFKQLVQEKTTLSSVA